MSQYLDDALKKHAAEIGDNGERYFGPAQGHSLADFQGDVAILENYEGQGWLKIVGEPHRESMSGDRHVDRIRVKLTPEGVKRWKS